MADSALTKEQVRARLTGLKRSIDNEILNLRDKNNRGSLIDLTMIQTLLGSVDRQIITDPKVKALLLSDDKTTRDEVQAIIDEEVAGIQHVIKEELTDIISFDPNAASLQSELNTTLEGNKTIKTVETIRQAESGEGDFKEPDEGEVSDRVNSLTAQHGYATLREAVGNPETEFAKVDQAFDVLKDHNNKIEKLNNNFLKNKVAGQKHDLQQLYNTTSKHMLRQDESESAKKVLASLAVFAGTDLGNKTISIDGADVKISELESKFGTLDTRDSTTRTKLTKIVKQLGNMRELEDVSKVKSDAKEIEMKKLFEVIDNNPVAMKFKKFPAEIKAFIEEGKLDKADDMITNVLRKISELDAKVGGRTAAEIQAELDAAKVRQGEMLDRERVNTAAGKVINGKAIDLKGIGIAEDHSSYDIEQDLTALDVTDAEKVGEVVESLYGKLNDEDRVNVGNALAIRKEDTTKTFGELGFFGKVGSIITLGIGHRIANMIRRRRDERKYNEELNAGVKTQLRSAVVDDASKKQGDARTVEEAKEQQAKYSEFDARYKVNLRAGIIENGATKTAEELKQDARAASKAPDEPKEAEDDGLEY